MAKEKTDEAEAAAKVELSPEEAAAKAKKKKLLLIIIAGAVATIGIGGGVVFFLTKGGSDPAHPPAAHGEEHADPKKDEHKTDEQKKEEPKKDEAKKDAEPDAKKDDKAAAGEKKDGKEAVPVKLPANVDIGCTHQFKSFNLNLGNPLENRYIRLELALEHGCAEEDKNELKLREPQLRDAIINVISKKTREFILSPDGKAQLTYEIRNQVNQRMSRPVKDVYITDILIE